MKFYEIVTFPMFFVAVASLYPNDFEICKPNHQCHQLRGLIRYDWESMTSFQQHLFKGRSWIIKPKESKTTITLVFKDFHVNRTIYIGTSRNGELHWTPVFPSLLNFERIETDIDSLTLYIPGYERGRLQVFFYVGCGILIEPSSDIIFPEPGSAVNVKKTCWILKPEGIQKTSRIYFTLRDIYLIKEAKIEIEELHSNTAIANVQKTSTFGIYGVDTAGHETILIDLICGNKIGNCENFGNLFFLSYYVLTAKEVNCVEMQKHCALDPWFHPTGSVCLETCPTLEHIIQKEIVKEGPNFPPQQPVLKSAALAAAFRFAQQLEVGNNKTERNQTEELTTQSPSSTLHSTTSEGEQDKDTKKEEMSQDERIQPTKSKSKSSKCQLKGKFCKCLRTRNDVRKYCFSKRKCLSYRQTCWKSCIFVRLTMCAEIVSSQSIKLLG